MANGVYRQGSDKRWTNGHREIYLVNFPVSALPEWHLAHEGVVGSVLYINRNPLAMKAAGNMPPSWGWTVGMNIIGIGPVQHYYDLGSRFQAPSQTRIRHSAC